MLGQGLRNSLSQYVKTNYIPQPVEVSADYSVIAEQVKAGDSEDSNIESFSLDKPENKTIFDTETVNVKYNTIQEKLSATYDE